MNDPHPPFLLFSSFIPSSVQATAQTYDESAFARHLGTTAQRAVPRTTEDIMDTLEDLREYDVPYHMRVAIDQKINVAKWSVELREKRKKKGSMKGNNEKRGANLSTEIRSGPYRL